MHFANKAHQVILELVPFPINTNSSLLLSWFFKFAGDLDSETLCAFEEIKQCIPGHLVGSKELLAGISSA
ncbi:hypothetical protein ES319_D03G165800v1 [Gossypium barbadense]|uniref:Uncharacterized protein n=3 Tax=Gossypium TaxID=3633 RepID=A0A5J5S8B4_GOSBA|nr:hypothetical protein ES319_D03G165800v1 [Gossypium barbadense]TYG77224.1 hypothetical protein ES288_D03G177500v1 [Gossypium darwinii]TYH81095.1 hypothetical protein ES332_D03G175800v1 [Gossypium tomentosum]